MNILLLGGTGAIGSAVLEELKNFDCDIYITSRSVIKNSQRITYINGDAKKIDFLKDVLRSREWGCIIDFMAYKTDEFSLRWNLLFKNQNRYFFLSSARVFADHKIIDETSLRLIDSSIDKNFLRSEEYSISKARQENIIIESESTGWVIIRPYITFGDNRLQLSVLEKEAWLYRALKGRRVVFPRSLLDVETTLTSSKDVAKVICNLVKTEGIKNEIFNVASEESITWQRVIDLYSKIYKENLDEDLPLLYVDDDAFINTIPGKAQFVYDRKYNRRFSCSKLKEYNLIDEFEKSEDCLRYSLERFLNNPRFRAIDWRHEARRDSITSDFAKYGEFNTVKDALKYFLFRIVR